MSLRWARLAAPAFALCLLAAAPAQAVIEGLPSPLGHHTVRVYGPYYCSGVAIGRQLVATARHCAHGGMRVLGSIGFRSASQTGVLDDGRRVRVSGDAMILKLTKPLPAHITPVGVGAGDGERYTIAGYGTNDERNRLAYGTLRQANLVAATPLALVDPTRDGSISASACFGDSGGPVLRNGVLVGIITRAAHPSPRIACGHLTRWTPIVVTGDVAEIASGTPKLSGDP